MIIRIVTFILMYVVSMNTAISQFDESLCFEYYQKYTSSFTAVEDYHEKALTHAHLSKSSGVYHMYFQQQLNGLDAIGGVLSLHVGKDGKLLKSHDRFYKNMKENHLPSLNLLSLEKVVASAWSLHGYNNVKNWYVDTIYQRPDQLTFVETGDYFYGKTNGRLVYVYTSDKLLTPSWEIKFENISGSEAWIVYIDAKTGTHLMSYNQVISCQYDHFKEPNSGFKKAFLPIATDTLPEYNVYPLKTESPNHGPRSLMIFSNDSLASPYDWHDVDGLPGHDFTTTKGNNVEAREDKDGVNNTPGQMADGGEDLNFDFTKLTGVHPHTNQNASITNLFFWNNLMHDVFYQYGFDESAGNFQSNNYDRGGIANDYVVAQAMDGGGTNNANFYTPPDGSLPRMQMYLWSGPVSMTVQSPQAIEGSYHFATASFGQGIFEIENELVLANDGSTQPSLGCNVFTNASEIAGKIAMVDRGNCEFGQKCLNAQNAGAIAVIVCNNVPGNPFVMGAGTFGHLVDIPCVMMSKEDCDSIKIYLDNPVEISMEVGHPVDGDFDDGIICHEYGHGISNRLTGGAGQTNCLNNEEQMGEGWSDWFALMMTMENNDDESRARGMGTYAKNQSVSGPGIRAYKYSTDVSVNPHTYQSIVSAVAPHGVGSVWCAMLWELTWALIREHGYDSDLYRGNGGNNKALALVVEALKLQPCNPGFVDGRNAILLADSLLFNGENNCLIWKSFAKRGLGFSATQGSPFSKTDGQEAFDMPSSCCLQVSNTNNDGIGSLRQAILCAENGDTITFLNFIKGDTIKLLDGPLNNQKIISIKALDQNQVFVQSMGAFSVFNNENQLLLENISLYAGTGSSGRIITNQGNLYLKNTKLIDPLLQSNNGESILNTGHIIIEEEVELTDD